MQNLNVIGVKELRQKMDYYSKKVDEGETFLVLRRSRPIFKISPIEEENWEEVVDFTKIKKGGVDIKNLIKRL